MARYLSFACLLSALVLGLLSGSHQVQHHPFLNPYVHPYAGPHVQPRLNLNVNDLNTLLVRTATVITATTVTMTSTATCTKSTAVSCDTANAANSLRFPFYFGIQKRSIEEKYFEDVEPSQVASVEPTAVPEEKMSRSFDAGFVNPYGIYHLDSSLSREIQPVETLQGRLFFGTTTTLTISTTTVTTTTRTLTPKCSTAGWFTQCP